MARGKRQEVISHDPLGELDEGVHALTGQMDDGRQPDTGRTDEGGSAGLSCRRIDLGENLTIQEVAELLGGVRTVTSLRSSPSWRVARGKSPLWRSRSAKIR